MSVGTPGMRMLCVLSEVSNKVAIGTTFKHMTTHYLIFLSLYYPYWLEVLVCTQITTNASL